MALQKFLWKTATAISASALNASDRWLVGRASADTPAVMQAQYVLDALARVAASASAVLNRLLPAQSGQAGKVLGTDGTNTSWQSAGAGDVVGPGSSADNALARFDGTTGKLVQGGGPTYSDAGNLTAATFTGAGTGLTGLATSNFGAGVVDTDGTLAANSDIKLATQKAVKSYTDNASLGLKWRTPVRAKTTAALPANTYNNGSSGVGATLTGNSNGALAAQDGVTLVLNDRLLVANESTGSRNGIYGVTQVGSGGTPYILTRSTDTDTGANLVNIAFQVSQGTAAANQIWTCNTPATITVGTTALTFVQVQGGTSGALQATNNLSDVANPATARANLGAGDATGPASATDNALARFDATTGKLLQNSPVTVDDDGSMYGFGVKFNLQVGTTYTLQASDAGKVVVLTNAAAIAVTAPNSLPVGFTCALVQGGAGAVTVTAGSGATANNARGSATAAAQYAPLSVMVTANSGGSAAVYLLGGDVLLAATSALSRTVTQSSHGLSVGNVVRHNGTGYAKAQANSLANAQAVGIVTAVPDANTVTVASDGSYVAGLSGLTGGSLYYLDPGTAGAMTSTEPTTVNQVTAPVFVATSSTAGYFLPQRPLLVDGIVTLTDAATIAWDLAVAPVAKVTLGGNRTLGAPTNGKAGRTYALYVYQDGTGGRTLTFNGAYRFPNGSDFVPSTGANSRSVLSFITDDGTNLDGTGVGASA